MLDSQRNEQLDKIYAIPGQNQFFCATFAFLSSSIDPPEVMCLNPFRGISETLENFFKALPATLTPAKVPQYPRPLALISTAI